jgi:hypothetical protein
MFSVGDCRPVTLLPFNFAALIQPPYIPAPPLPDKEFSCEQSASCFRALELDMLPCFTDRLFLLVIVICLL